MNVKTKKRKPSSPSHKRIDCQTKILIKSGLQEWNYTFPEPKNPVIIVAGILSSGGILVKTSESSLCGVDVVDAEAVNLQEKGFGFEAQLTDTILELVEQQVKYARPWGILCFLKPGKTAVPIVLSRVGCLLAKPTKVVAISIEIEAMAKTLDLKTLQYWWTLVLIGF